MRTDPAGVAGVLGVALPAAALVVVPIWDFPGTSASAADVLAWATRHREGLQAVMVLNTLGVTLWAVLGAGVWARLAASGPTLTAACFAVGLAGFTTLLLAGFTAFDLLVYRAPEVADARVLYDLAFGLLAMSGPPTAVAMIAFATWVGRERSMPLHSAGLAVLAAIAHLLLLASLVVRTGPLSLESVPITAVPAPLFAWILDVGIVLLRGGPAVPHRVTPWTQPMSRRTS